MCIFYSFSADDVRELNGHPESEEDIKRLRSSAPSSGAPYGGNAQDLYNMWSPPNNPQGQQPQPPSKWPASGVKEEPKTNNNPSTNSATPTAAAAPADENEVTLPQLPELLSNNSGSTPGETGAAPNSPHHPQQQAYQYSTPVGFTPNSDAGSAAVFTTVAPASSSTASDLLYDSINMSQVQNYTPSLSS